MSNFVLQFYRICVLHCCSTTIDGVLTFDRDFNQKLNGVCFPDNVHTIRFGPYFNQKLDNVRFSNGLHTLIFGCNFNQKLDNVGFPNNLRIIQFGTAFNQNIDDVKFPDKLHTVRFGQNFDQKLDNVKFPNTLHTVKFGYCFTRSIFFMDNLHTVDYSDLDIEYIRTTRNNPNIELPPTLREIIVNKSYKGQLKIPYGCIEICV